MSPMLTTLSLGIVTGQVNLSGFGQVNSGVKIRVDVVDVLLPKALTQVACICG